VRPILLLVLSLLQPGPHAVGSRADGALTIWYPALSGGEVMRYRDYVPALEDADAFLHAMKISDETIVGLFDSRMTARRDAPPKQTRFPLVLIFQGNGQNAADQAVLAEHIASHGYVVATLPGPIVRDESEMGAKAQEQAVAFANALKTLAKRPNVDARNVSAIGHSFGARSMLLFAMRHPTRALISLDGGIGTANGIEPLRSATKKPLPPLLHLYEDNDAFMKPDHTFLRSLRTATLSIEKVDAMRHAHFTTWGFAAVALPELGKATRASDATKADVLRVAERVVAFLKKPR
jgi:dienelactone hydrolase